MDNFKSSEADAGRGTMDEALSLYRARGRFHVGTRDPETCFTATIETVDDDRASSLLGVLAPS